MIGLSAHKARWGVRLDRRAAMVLAVGSLLILGLGFVMGARADGGHDGGPESVVVGCDGPPDQPAQLRVTFVFHGDEIVEVVAESGFGPDVDVPGGVWLTTWDAEGVQTGQGSQPIVGTAVWDDVPGGTVRARASYAEPRYGSVDSAEPQGCDLWVPWPDDTPTPTPEPTSEPTPEVERPVTRTEHGHGFDTPSTTPEEGF